MNMNFPLTALLVATSVIAADQESAIPSRERIRFVHQDISQWDKNGDGKLTGRERDEFLKAKQKEMADAAAAAEAARVKLPKIARAGPALSPEDVGKPVPKGMPKNIEDAAK